MPWFTSIRVADINLARVLGQRFVPNDLTVAEINNTATKWLETNGEPRNENPSWTEMIVFTHETHFELFITHTKLSRTSVYLHAIDPQISSFSETIKTWVMRTDCRYQTFVSSWSQIDHNFYFRGLLVVKIVCMKRMDFMECWLAIKEARWLTRAGKINERTWNW